MSVARIASRYAKSLFDLAINENKLDKINQDIELVNKVAELKDFDSVMKNPLIIIDRKQAAIRGIFQDKVDTLTMNTMMVILEHRRERYLQDICRSFHDLYNSEKKVSIVTLKSAVSLSQEMSNNILHEFKSKGLIEDKVELKTIIDPSIIGGFVIYFKDQVYNASVSYKLDQLRTKFSENLYIKNF
jgi:F-type H+-transporting ATPase subunit delta